ncbi:MAG: Rrf2 family transcriptional regulator [Peptostreptococcus porci]|nr:Rrf2 family transcriptional regulator [Peptostreptococcus porci]
MKGRKMQLNKTTDYAVRILVFLGRKSDFVSSDEISRATSISKNYTIKILRILTSEEIVKMKRGIKGGFLLNKPPSEINLYEIFVAMERTIKINQCLDNEESCNLYENDICPVRNFYLILQQEFEEKLKSMTIEKLGIFKGG